MSFEAKNISSANELPEGFFNALERWRIEAERIHSSGEIQWYAKLAHTNFVYNGINYVIYPEDVYSKTLLDTCPRNCLDAGFEILQKTIGADLIELGAEKITHIGFLD